MDFLVLAKIKLDNSGICIIKNLYASFNTPDGYFFIKKEDLRNCILKSENIIHVAREFWDKILFCISENQVKELGL